MEGERQEGEQRREKDAQRVPAKVEYRHRFVFVRTINFNDFHRLIFREIPMSRTVNQQIQIEKPIERVIYIDEPAPRMPSAATRAFVRNLSSTSVQQHMNWESESLHTQRTNSDLFVEFLFTSNFFSTSISFSDFQSLRRRDFYRKLYPDDDPLVESLSNKKFSPSKRQSRGTGTRTPPPVNDRTELRECRSFSSSFFILKVFFFSSGNAATSPRKPHRFVEVKFLFFSSVDFIEFSFPGDRRSATLRDSSI